MSQPLKDHRERLLDDLPPGHLVGPSQDPHPFVWLSDGPVRGAADWWVRLYSRHSETGLYPLLLEYPDDSFEPVGAGGVYAAGADAASYLRREWTKNAWAPFEEWPGLAAPAAVVADVALPAGELATALVRSSRAQCLALVEVSRGADAPAALNWLGPANHITAEELSAVLRSLVRVLARGPSSAFSQVSAIRLVRRCAWKCRVVHPCCRRRCRQTALRVREVEWALAGVLPGLGSGMVRGPYAGPATRAGCAPARNLNEWPPGLARRGPRPGKVGKAHGADRPHRRAAHQPTPRRRLAVGLVLAVRERLVFARFRSSATRFCAAWSLAGPRWRSRERAGWAAVPRATRVSGSP